MIFNDFNFLKIFKPKQALFLTLTIYAIVIVIGQSSVYPNIEILRKNATSSDFY